MSSTATLIGYTQITNQSDISGQGSGHGPQHLRLLRLADGTLYGQYLTANPNPRPVGDNDDYHKHTHIVRSTDGGVSWTEIASFESGFTSGELFTLNTGTIYLLCTPNGQPNLWDSVSNTLRPIPGAFQTHWPSGSVNVSPYNALGVAPDGSYAVFSRSRVNPDPSNPNKPCTYEFQRINADGTFGPFWTATVPAGRYTYGHLYIGADGLIRWFGYYDVLPAEGGYTAVNNQVGYLFTDPTMLVFDPAMQSFVGAHVIYTGTPQAGGAAPTVQLVDAIQLASGDFLVAYTGLDGQHGTYFNEIARVNADGSVPWRSNGPFSYGGLYRFVALSGGQMAVVNAAAGSGTDGVFHYATIDPATGMISAAQSLDLTGLPMDWNPGPENEYTLSRRAGIVPPDDLCLLWFETTGGGGCGLQFIAVSFAGTPTPTPTPDPCADVRAQLHGEQAANAVLTGQVAGLLSQVADLKAQLVAAQNHPSLDQLIATNAQLAAQMAAKSTALHAIAQAVNAANVLP